MGTLLDNRWKVLQRRFSHGFIIALHRRRPYIIFIPRRFIIMMTVEIEIHLIAKQYAIRVSTAAVDATRKISVRNSCSSRKVI